METSRIISNMINNYTFFVSLIIFIVSGLILLIKFKTLSKSKKNDFSLNLDYCYINSVFIFVHFLDFGKSMPEYIKRGLNLLSSNYVNIDKIDFLDNALIVEGKSLDKLECEEIIYEKDGDKSYIMLFSNMNITEDGKFRYKIEGNFDSIKYVYLRSIEGGVGGLEDKLVYTK